MNSPQHIHPDILYAIRLLEEDKELNGDKAVSIIETTIANYDNSRYPDYATGLSGIGYGVQYIINSGLVDATADEVLREFDKRLFLDVYFREHTDLTQATGLIGIASYFLGRLEDPHANNNNLSTLSSKCVLLSVLDILSARLGLNGFVYQAFKDIAPLSAKEKEDIRWFISQILHYNICNEQALKLLNSLDSTTEDLSDVTIVIPIRIDGYEREENLKTIIRLYTQLTNVNFILLEADVSQHFHIECNERIKYIFQKDTNPVFYLTHHRNEMIKMVETPIVAVWDTDIVVPLKQLYESVNEIRRGNAVLSCPYNGICYDVPDAISSSFRETLDCDMLIAEQENMSTIFGLLSVGGVFLADRRIYTELGLENENIRSWGPEDIERLRRLVILDVPVHRADGCVYHLYHPRGMNSGFVGEEYDVAGKRELLRICQMNKRELSDEIKTWMWIK